MKAYSKLDADKILKTCDVKGMIAWEECDGKAKDFEEQQREAKKWYNLGYRVEPARACTELSTGTKCVYGISVYIPGGTCGEVVGDILIDWHERKYITNVARAKEMGYECKGYEE